MEWPRPVTLPAILHGSHSSSANAAAFSVTVLDRRDATESQFLQSTLQSKHNRTWTLMIQITDRCCQITSTAISYSGSLWFKSSTDGQLTGAVRVMPQTLLTKSQILLQSRPNRLLLQPDVSSDWYKMISKPTFQQLLSVDYQYQVPSKTVL